MSRTGAPRSTVAKWIREMLPKKCMNCGATHDLQYHHIVPVICGGNEIPSNVAVLCSDCHSKVHYGKGGVINHGDAVKKGQQRAKANGVRLGRKPIDAERVMRTIAENSTQFNDIYDPDYEPKTEQEIMDMIGIKNVQYAKYKRMLLSAMKEDVWSYDWAKPVQVRNVPLYDHCVKKLRGEVV